MKSMTGYAYLESSVYDSDISCELKSYNSRFFDLNLSIPAWMNQLDPFLRKFFSQRIIRGKVDFYLRVKKIRSGEYILPNIPLAQAYYQAMAEIAQALNMENQITLDLLLKQEGVLQFDRTFDEQLWQSSLLPVLNTLFIKYDEGRSTEGQALYTDIQNKIDNLVKALTEIENNAVQMERIFTSLLKKKFTDLMEHEPDQQRIMQEIAVLLVKYTINEEIIRAKAHIRALQREIAENQAPGKRIDFLCQEINREINTIGSKNQLAAIGQAVILAKDALENIREQAHNIE